jgi:hypothetical protein
MAREFEQSVTRLSDSTRAFAIARQGNRKQDFVFTEQENQTNFAYALLVALGWRVKVEVSSLLAS